jgi:hypothetical protein
MRNILKTMLGVLFGVLITTPVLADKSGGFTFSYNVGTSVTNYHAYGVAIQVYPHGILQPQPPGTVILGYWYVWDLGPVSGTGTVNCPQVMTLKGERLYDRGILFIASAHDVGGDGSTAVFTHPVGDIQVIIGKPDYDYVEIIEPDDTGLQLYYGPAFSPFTGTLARIFGKGDGVVSNRLH